MLKELKVDFQKNKKYTTRLSLTIYRLGNGIYYKKFNKVLKLLLLLPLKIINKLYNEIIIGVQLPFQAQIGAGVRMCHPQGIIISEKAKIGNNCTIYHYVTIGNDEHSETADNITPTVGNNVYIGCGAKIIGGILVGDNSKIGANSVVVKNVPKNATVYCKQYMKINE